MRNLIICLALVSVKLFSACQKDGMMSNTLGVDVKGYEILLKQAYTKAYEYHAAFGLSNNATNDEHAAHHGGTTNTVPVDSDYNKMMFNMNDSLFSEHFYKFCIDMIQNFGMMGNQIQMMGNNSNMMGTGDMMNGSTMGSQMDMGKMMEYMDSLHSNTKNKLEPNYKRHDSLLFNQMKMCNMMINETIGIEQNFQDMQQLRKEHEMLHRNQ